MLKYIFGGIFVVLAWALALVFQGYVPMWTAVVATIVIVGGLTLYVVLRMVAGRVAAAKIEKGLRAQASEHAEGIRPDMRGEIAAMEAEFQRAVQSLKNSKLGRNARDVLGLLPWYVIIGPSASGKTTAIRNSGIKLPLGKSGKVKGVGGTRNCDWWMTNDAILLDTAGRWSTEDDDRDEWLAFLDLLKRTRPKKPINGVLLAVSATDLLGNEQEIANLSAALRERIEELITRLEMVVPVYLMVTKCDLIAGFVESFGDLKDRERGQIWGFSLPVIRDNSDQVEVFAQHFDDLMDVLERHTVVRLGEERRIEARDQIYAFPRQFDSLRQGLIDLVASLFEQNVYADGPIMRGVYFTSGTQEGRPVDRVMASMAEAFGVRPPAIATPTTKPKSYFVRDLFYKVVFPDQDVAIRSRGVLRRERFLRWGMAIGALAISTAFLLLPMGSYYENKQLVDDSSSFVDKLIRSREERGKAVFAPGPLESADPMATRLTQIVLKGPDVSMRFGLYPGDTLLNPLRVAIERLVVLPILNADATRLLEYANGRPGSDSGAGAMDGLALHLLLTHPKAADEPAPENDDWRDRWVDIAAGKASERWAARPGEDATAKARRTIESSVRFYGLRAFTSPDLIERSAPVVSRVRATLLKSDDGDPLAEFIHDPDLPRDVRLIDVLGGAVSVFQGTTVKGKNVTDVVVKGAYTPDGWKVIKDRIQSRTSDQERVRAENSWLLAAPRKEKGVDAGKLFAAYFRQYVASWRTFLLTLAVTTPGSIEESRSIIRSLIMQKPLDAVWKNATKYLVFKDDSPLDMITSKAEKTGFMKKMSGIKRRIVGGDEIDLDEAAAKATGEKATKPGEDPRSPEDVGREFATFLSFGNAKPSSLDTYTQTLGEVQAALGDKGSPDPKTFSQVAKTSRNRLQAMLANFNDHGWEMGLLERILMPPINGAEIAVSGATGDSSNRKWCDTVVVVFDQLLAGRYPFGSGKRLRESRLADVDKFFQPKTGVVWQYFTDTLAVDFEHPPNTTVFKLKEEPSVPYKANLPAFLKRAQELTDLLYPKEATKPLVAVQMRIRASVPYTKIVFESGARKLTYFNAKERWEDLAWPGRGAIFRFFDRNLDGQLGFPEGEWALFRLLDEGKMVMATEDDEYLAGTWVPPAGGPPIHADVKPASLLRAFRGIDVPRGIVAGASGCR